MIHMDIHLSIMPVEELASIVARRIFRSGVPNAIILEGLLQLRYWWFIYETAWCCILNWINSDSSHMIFPGIYAAY